MKRKIITGAVILFLLLVGITFICKTGKIPEVKQSVTADSKVPDAAKQPRTVKVKSAEDVKIPQIKTAVTPEKKQAGNSKTDQIIVPKSKTEVYEGYLEGSVVGKKNLGGTNDSSLDESHFYLYVRTLTGQVKMYRITENIFNALNNGDRILYKKSKDDKVIKVSDDKWE